MTPTGTDKHQPPGAATPWWRVGMVWLVLAGPLAVVIAGIATAVIAVRGADVVVTSHEAQAPFSQRPAVQGRNHAVSPQDSKP